jgi:hypothetical protein
MAAPKLFAPLGGAGRRPDRMLILGFDPGGLKRRGLKRFGWCAAEPTPHGKLKLRKWGVADHAAGAVEAALKATDDPAHIVAAGIDSPLFWVPSGSRRADKTIRDALTALGAKNTGGTVQEVNSLRGACLAQGIMTAHLLRERVPAIRITESHPKALLWLLKVASKDRRAAEVRMSHLRDVITCESEELSEHERDAALGAFAAWAMLTEQAGWRDLFQVEDKPFVPVPPVEYWMPV